MRVVENIEGHILEVEFSFWWGTWHIKVDSHEIRKGLTIFGCVETVQVGNWLINVHFIPYGKVVVSKLGKVQKE